MPAPSGLCRSPATVITRKYSARLLNDDLLGIEPIRVAFVAFPADIRQWTTDMNSTTDEFDGNTATANDDPGLRQSKSAAKRECHQLTDIGAELLKLSADDRRTLDLPGNIEDAIKFALTIKSRGAAKRQRLTIGKLLRSMDREAIEDGLKKIQHSRDANNARFKRLEMYRDRLIDNDKQALNEVIAQYPDLDRQHTNQLIRAAHQQQQAEKPPVAARKLFKYLRELDQAGRG